MTDLATRVSAIAAKARASAPTKRDVMTHAPCLTAWLSEWYARTGEKAHLLRAFWPGGEYRA